MSGKTAETASSSNSEAPANQAELTGDEIRKNPDLDIAQLRFLVNSPDYEPKKKKEALVKLTAFIEEHCMAPYYKELCEELGTPMDQKLFDRMDKENKTKLEEMDSKIKDAIDNLGESEVRESLLKKAEYLCEIGDKDGAVTAFRLTYEKTVGMGNRIDLVFYLIRMGLFYMDHQIITTNITKIKDLMEQGGDWDRKNRLKAYEGVYKMSVREFADAATLFLDCVSTFSSYEIMSYERLIFYTVVTSVFALDRPDLRKRVIRGAEIQEQLHGQSQLKEFLTTLYDCEYAAFFKSLVWLENEIKFDRYLNPHYGNYVREMRVKAYSQLLSSYRSLSLQSMADIFGVTSEFVDKELHRMIGSGAIHCKIDAVKGIVETNQLESKNYQFQNVLRDGDILLNRIQKLSRVINT